SAQKRKCSGRTIGVQKRICSAEIGAQKTICSAEIGAQRRICSGGISAAKQPASGTPSTTVWNTKGLVRAARRVTKESIGTVPTACRTTKAWGSDPSKETVDLSQQDR